MQESVDSVVIRRFLYFHKSLVCGVIYTRRKLLFGTACLKE